MMMDPDDRAPHRNEDVELLVISSLALDARDDEILSYFNTLDAPSQDRLLASVRAAAMFINHRHGPWAGRVLPMLRAVVSKRNQ